MGTHSLQVSKCESFQCLAREERMSNRENISGGIEGSPVLPVPSKIVRNVAMDAVGRGNHFAVPVDLEVSK
jgi:hypothetical protein